MPRTLPTRPDLNQLRTQAKELLLAWRSGDQSTPLSSGFSPTLATAQHILARSYGFASWPKLKQHVEAMRMRPTRTQVAADRVARRHARQQHIETQANMLLAAAQANDIGSLLDALFAPLGEMEGVRAHLVERGHYTPVIDTLIANAAHPQPRVRFLVAQAMDHFADERCATTLHTLLRDPVPRVRWAAIHSLSCEACKLAPLPQINSLTETLIELALHDPSIKVRRVAAYELGASCQDSRALALLPQLVVDPDPTIARNARQALKQRQDDESRYT